MALLNETTIDEASLLKTAEVRDTVIGSAVGAKLGLDIVGIAVGLRLGCIVGDELGFIVVGEKDGSELGIIVGITVG